MTTKDKITNYRKQLHISALGSQVHHLSDKAATEGLSYLEFAAKILETDFEHRNKSDMIRKVKAAKLLSSHQLQGYDCAQSEGIPPAKLQQLKEPTCLDQNFNLVIMGPNGVENLFLAPVFTIMRFKMVTAQN